uniref:Uncharacterized protein n=1 Tax=Anguilla anguilla TaxID=7936 RepID=A0A0E9PW20_ANGAN
MHSCTQVLNLGHCFMAEDSAHSVSEA